mgnify:CR=1 FL=1
MNDKSLILDLFEKDLTPFEISEILSLNIEDVISNLKPVDGVKIFHAGTKNSGELVSSGGRVLTVTGLGADLTEARDAAYRTISQIKLEGSFYRNDIALNASVAEKGN